MLRVFILWIFGFGLLDSWLDYSEWNTEMKIAQVLWQEEEDAEDKQEEGTLD